MKRESQKAVMPTSAAARVVLIDEHAGTREALAEVLVGEDGILVVGQAGGGCEALKLCRALKPDVVILELSLSDLAGLHVLRGLRESLPGVKVVIFTGTEQEGALRAALATEPEGFVRKSDRLEVLRAALQAVVAGGRYWSGFAKQLAVRPEALLERLTEKELAVLQMLARGKMTKEIAEVLDAKPKTVDHHRQHLMDKLGLHDVASLTRFAVRAGL